MMKSTQKSSLNDASARSEKATEILAKGAGPQCHTVFTANRFRQALCPANIPTFVAGLLCRISNCFFIHPAAGLPFAQVYLAAGLPGRRQAGLRTHSNVMK
jgi:hypothetical protein